MGLLELLAQSEHLPAPASHALLLVVAFVVALATSILITRTLRGRAPGLGLSESPRHLTSAAPAVAKIGGIAIALTIGVIGPLLWAGFGERGFHPTEHGPLLAVLGGAGVMVLLGVWDDLRELRARTKLVVQVIAAAAVWLAGVRFGAFAAPGGLVQLLPAASLLVTVFWFVALTNAFNLVDGADGVAGGAALTAILAMFVVSIFLGQSMAAYLLAVAAGAVIGFLFYNFPPASVYLGDAGSLSLGFMLAGVGLVTSAKATTLLAVAIPVVSLGLPIMDTTFAVIRRTIRGESIASRDQGHIHHRLARLGHSPRRVALLLFAASSVLAFASLLLLTPDLRLVGITYALLGIVVFIGLQRLKMPEMLELRRAIARGLRVPGNGEKRPELTDVAAALSEADGLAAKLEVLGRVLEEATDFVEAEIRMVEGRREDEAGRIIWEWRRADTAVASTDWESRGQLRDGETTIAWLTLRRPRGSDSSGLLDTLINKLGPILRSANEDAQEGVGAPFGRPTEDEIRRGAAEIA